MISIIAAMANNHVIGNQGGMPWHLPAELAHFKKLTLGNAILMGRRTFYSIGRPLPNRRNLVLSQQTDLHLSGCEIFSSLEAVCDQVNLHEELMVIGGGNLYQQTLPFADRLYLTLIDCDVTGDTFFPDWNPDEWKETNRSFHPADKLNCYNFHTIQYDKKER